MNSTVTSTVFQDYWFPSFGHKSGSGEKGEGRERRLSHPAPVAAEEKAHEIDRNRGDKG